MESSKGEMMNDAKKDKLDKQLKLKNKNVLKWKSVVEIADEKAAKFHL